MLLRDNESTQHALIVKKPESADSVSLTGTVPIVSSVQQVASDRVHRDAIPIKNETTLCLQLVERFNVQPTSGHAIENIVAEAAILGRTAGHVEYAVEYIDAEASTIRHVAENNAEASRTDPSVTLPPEELAIVQPNGDTFVAISAFLVDIATWHIETHAELPYAVFEELLPVAMYQHNNDRAITWHLEEAAAETHVETEVNLPVVQLAAEQREDVNEDGSEYDQRAAIVMNTRPEEELKRTEKPDTLSPSRRARHQNRFREVHSDTVSAGDRPVPIDQLASGY